ncbi:hypothetical protein [Aeromonas hydrophila]|uniref:hypothetical protein n=1 Tax=Aeromonas hydrophila TaxID=644 RepID=UPI003D1D6118
MVSVTKIQAGQYAVGDGRFIIKDGSSWYVVTEEGKGGFGPLPTLSAAKEYVNTGSTPLGHHNTGSAYGRRQSKKEFNACLASEVQKGNYGPAIL